MHKGIDPLDAEYLKHRLELFETITEPSVRGQTSLRFDWILLIDHRSPEWLVTKLKRMAHVIPLSAKLDDTSLYHTLVENGFLNRSVPSLTTRLDNDDAIAPEFIEEVSHHAARLQPLDDRIILNFSEGEVLELHTNILRPARNLSNAFITLRTTLPETVYGFQHHLAAQHGALVQLPGSARWRRTLHSSNISGPYSHCHWADSNPEMRSEETLTPSHRSPRDQCS